LLKDIRAGIRVWRSRFQESGQRTLEWLLLRDRGQLMGKRCVYRVIVSGLMFGLAGCGDQSVTETWGFQEAFALAPEDGWVVLSRPNSIWDVGTVLEHRESSIEDIGTIKDLDCFPGEHWIVETGSAPESAYTRAINYDLSLAATLGLPQAEMAKVGLSVGGNAGGGGPAGQTSFSVKKATEKRVSSLKLEQYIENNYAGMNNSCKRLLLDARRFLIDKIYRIDAGELVILGSNGAKVDLGLPQYKPVADAAVKAGFGLNKTGSLTVQEPVTFAVRAADFGGVLEHLGIAARAPSEKTFPEVMSATGTSLPY
jgi:hypothetical protein